VLHSGDLEGLSIMDAVSRLIGSTSDFSEGARDYLDSLEGQAIGLFDFDKLPDGDREAIVLLTDVLRPAFDELANTFVEPHRKTDPALAERGYRMLWALMKAAADMADATHDSTARRKLADAMANSRELKRDRQEEFAKAVKAEADLIGIEPAKGPNFVRKVAPGLQERIGSKKMPGKDRIFAAVDLIRDSKREGGF
jgi:hypothetical protein